MAVAVRGACLIAAMAFRPKYSDTRKYSSPYILLKVVAVYTKESVKSPVFSFSSCGGRIAHERGSMGPLLGFFIGFPHQFNQLALRNP